MEFRSLRAEWIRETARPATLGFIAFHAVVVAALAWGLGAGLLIEGYLWTVHLLLPLALAPFAAAAMTRDDQTGFGRLLAFTPLTPVARFGGTVLSLLTLLLVTATMSTVATWLLAEPFGALVRTRALAFAGWGLLVGLAALLMGAFAAQAFAGRPALALTAAFSGAGAWALAGVLAPDVVALLAPVSPRAGLLVTHLSPVTWAADALGAHRLLASDAGVANRVAGTLLLAASLAAAAVLVLLLQSKTRRTARTPVTLTALIVVCIGVLVVLVADQHPFHDEEPAWTASAATDDAGVRGVIEGRAGIGRLDLAERQRLSYVLDAHGAPGSTRTITRIDARSDDLALRVATPLPITIQVGEDGRGRAVVPLDATPQRVQGRAALVTLDMDVDGRALRDVEMLTYGPDFSAAYLVHALPLSLAPFVDLGIVVAFMWAVPRRWNAWTR